MSAEITRTPANYTLPNVNWNKRRVKGPQLPRGSVGKGIFDQEMGSGLQSQAMTDKLLIN